ncbi:beta-ketoacyl synthase N-terminal-like domain-containing protein [Pseudomonas grimontii]|uniref:beta-ketoacyl synthase N-terminal-like domain-containing protein n=1 Tax=Pseudomonas grimontii TaxID=129847 RepID=UPI0028EF2DD1|nr:beta-ketoacyl synthase N-terminal-like domain-containing protein [Pseudomonas grimontii]
MSNQKVVISGFGCCTPLGDNYTAIEEALREGHSGIRKINKYCTDTFKSHFAGIPAIGNFLMASERQRFSHEEFYTATAWRICLLQLILSPLSSGSTALAAF